jgi:SpoVK/Ycf46/Vps4 family AAA+-type ATPase
LTAAALAGELHIPLFTAQLEGIITKFMGETAAKLKVVFDSMTSASGVYFFDEFDALGAKRSALNDVGEVRRILNSFLQLLEGESSSSLIVAATNHPELLDQALYRRFDDVLEYSLPNESQREVVLRTRLSSFDLSETAWEKLLESTRGLSHAELVRAAEDAAKSAILRGNSRVTTKDLQVALEERKYTRP